MSLTMALHRGVQQHPTRTFSVFGDRVMTYAQTADRVSRIAGGFKELGLDADDRVALLALNSDVYLQTVLAVAWADAVIVPVNTRWSLTEIADSLAEAEVSMLVVDENFTAMAAELSRLVPGIRWVIAADELTNTGPQIPDAHRSGDNPIGIFYTGGTTGRSRGVVLSHSALVSSALGCAAGSPIDPSSVCLISAPLFHLAQFSGWVASMIMGTSHVIIATFDPVEVMRIIEKRRVTRAVLVPTMLHMLLNHPKEPDFDLTSLATVTYGGSPISPATLSQAQQRWPQTGFLQVYGMTEMAATVTMLAPDAHNDPVLIASAGQAAPHTVIRIVDPNGADVPTGEIGEVVVRGDGMMTEYWQRPDETAAVIRDGWFHTGDAGRLNDDGYVFIVDRVKDMIVSGGENVYSAEVENAVATHPSVSQCAVIGLPDETWGERVHAVVVLHNGADLALQDLQSHCRSAIAGYKCPRGLTVVDALPLSPTGKVLKRELRKAHSVDAIRETQPT
ncbi:long-chain-fatty-acid--CoA ligase [Mycobacterium paragordonae]|uniref:acyl-CoA synthetase n=1 Tax=Mycobacterium paragordonae TaxID=1389713 RepID=UPI00105BE0BD|nr:long-chain fatty acid--CoA ligase [Mycobacterium paragordonae]TDK94325.1 long-chain-fatty-acid--CoA ligase [Mycobacterium paragordonae]